MHVRLQLEVFEPAGALARADGPSEAPVSDPDAQEEARLAGFEQGYKAGWDNATSTREAEQTHLGAELARNLQELSFTYHEARAHLLRGLAPLLEALVGRLLPDTARAVLGALVVERLMPLAEAAASRPITVAVGPDALAAVTAALSASPSPPFEMRTDASLGDARVCLRFDDTELDIDPGAAMAEIAIAIREHFQNTEPKEKAANG